MPVYRVENSRTGQAFLVNASNTEAACKRLGWVAQQCIFWIEHENQHLAGGSSSPIIQVEPQHLGLLNYVER